MPHMGIHGYVVCRMDRSLDLVRLGCAERDEGSAWCSIVVLELQWCNVWAPPRRWISFCLSSAPQHNLLLQSIQHGEGWANVALCPPSRDRNGLWRVEISNRVVTPYRRWDPVLAADGTLLDRRPSAAGCHKAASRKERHFL